MTLTVSRQLLTSVAFSAFFGFNSSLAQDVDADVGSPDSSLVNSVVEQNSKEKIPELANIYRIEMLVFKDKDSFQPSNDQQDAKENTRQRKESSTKKNIENLGATHSLKYPENLIFLRPPIKNIPSAENRKNINGTEGNEINKAEISSDEIILAGEQAATSNLAITASTLEGEITTLTKAPLAEGASTDNATVKNILTEEEVLSSLNLMLQLEPETFLLQKMASAIRLRSKHKIIFHQAWHQEVTTRGSSAAIPISGGDRYDKHNELEGNITISKGRYLHIDADLWLTEYRMHIGDQREDLTKKPTGNSIWASRITDTNPIPDFPLDLVRIAEEKAIRKAEIAQSIVEEALYVNDIAEAINLRATNANKQISINQNHSRSRSRNYKKDHPIALLPSDINNTEEVLAFNLYQVEKIHVLQEERKIKRGEIHFLDHPMFGVIVQINKYEPILDSEEETITP